ncbi:hypothetical protein M5689_002283 [Euphorbia peplus]|nr:hypothetical protein M5689_002283 [Euphorbia peplus]
MDSYCINNVTSFNLKVNLEILREVLKDPVNELPHLLPQIYKRMTMVSDNPPAYIVEYTQGCAINVDVVEVYDPIVTLESIQASYKQLAGDLIDYYKSFNYTVLFTSLLSGGTSVQITYDFVELKVNIDFPAILEFYINNLIELDQVLTKKI